MGEKSEGLLPTLAGTSATFVEISIADLAAADKLDPLAGARSTENVGRSRLESDLATARHELALAGAWEFFHAVREPWVHTTDTGPEAEPIQSMKAS